MVKHTLLLLIFILTFTKGLIASESNKDLGVIISTGATLLPLNVYYEDTYSSGTFSVGIRLNNVIEIATSTDSKFNLFLDFRLAPDLMIYKPYIGIGYSYYNYNLEYSKKPGNDLEQYDTVFSGDSHTIDLIVAASRFSIRELFNKDWKIDFLVSILSFKMGPIIPVIRNDVSLLGDKNFLITLGELSFIYYF